MKNKKGFTLVELLAVIVILALIMGIAVVGIGSVLDNSKKNVIRESAAGMIDGVRKQLYVVNKTPATTGTFYYGFNDTILESGGKTTPWNDNILYGTKGSSDEEIVSGIWKLATAPAACASATFSYIKVVNGVYSVCLKAANSGPYVDGTEADINAGLDSVIKGLS